MEGYKIATERLKEMIGFYETTFAFIEEQNKKDDIKIKIKALTNVLEAIEKDWVEYGEGNRND